MLVIILQLGEVHGEPVAADLVLGPFQAACFGPAD